MNTPGVVNSSSRARSRNGLRGHKGAHYVTNTHGDHLLAGVHFSSFGCDQIKLETL